jgi:hypothetical protein
MRSWRIRKNLRRDKRPRDKGEKMDTMNKVLQDINSQRRYGAKEVMTLLRISAADLERLEQEGQLKKLGPMERGGGLYHPSHVLKLLQRR